MASSRWYAAEYTLPADLTSVTFPAIPEQKYSGKALTPSFTPTYNGTELVKDVDYIATYSNNTNAGTATVTITCKDGSTKMVKGTDYTVSYSNNKNVGKAKVVIKGKGNYTGTKTLYFKINPKGTSIKSLTKASKAITVNGASSPQKWRTIASPATRSRWRQTASTSD